MSSVATEPIMGTERKSVPFQLRCEPLWIARVESAANAIGLSAAAYIRMKVTQAMNADGVPNPKQAKPKKKD